MTGDDHVSIARPPGSSPERAQRARRLHRAQAMSERLSALERETVPAKSAARCTDWQPRCWPAVSGATRWPRRRLRARATLLGKGRRGRALQPPAQAAHLPPGGDNHPAKGPGRREGQEGAKNWSKVWLARAMGPWRQQNLVCSRHLCPDSWPGDSQAPQADRQTELRHFKESRHSPKATSGGGGVASSGMKLAHRGQPLAEGTVQTADRAWPPDPRVHLDLSHTHP